MEAFPWEESLMKCVVVTGLWTDYDMPGER